MVGAPEIVHVPSSTLSPVGREGEKVQVAPDNAERVDDAVI